jgi:hypothetical protein
VAPTFWLWINTVRVFLDLERKISVEKYLAWYFKMYVEGGAETLNYIGL